MENIYQKTLPSGANLSMNIAPFTLARKLYQAVLRELQLISVADLEASAHDIVKNLFCAGFASEEIERLTWECMGRCTYNGLKIDANTFEAENARQDYIWVVAEVVQKNIDPFLKGLYARFREAMSILENLPK